MTRLLEVTQGQWLYRNVHVHDALMGDKKKDIRRELDDQMEIGGEGLAEEDMYLLDRSTLTTWTGLILGRRSYILAYGRFSISKEGGHSKGVRRSNGNWW